MGFPHGYEAPELISNNERRTQVIREYAREMFGALDDLVVKNQLELTPAETHKALIDYLSFTDIFRVTDPRHF